MNLWVFKETEMGRDQRKSMKKWGKREELRVQLAKAATKPWL